MSPLDFATIFFVNLDDTIVAIATPPGRGGIGVVRLAGPDARSIALPMLRLKHDLEPGRAVFGELVEPCGACPELAEGSDTPFDRLRAGFVRPVAECEADEYGAGALSREDGKSDLGHDAGHDTSRTEPALSLPKGLSAPHRLDQRIDEVVVTYFAKPHSYTTDDIV